jgi:hypothetical protein
MWKWVIIRHHPSPPAVTEEEDAMIRAKPTRWSASDDGGWWVQNIGGYDCLVLPALNDDDEVVAGFTACVCKEGEDESLSLWELEKVYKTAKTAKHAVLNLLDGLLEEERVPSPADG